MQIIEIREPGQAESKQEAKIAVGIDFGTTNSLIAISVGRKVKIIQTEDNKELIPTTIEFTNNNITVGSNKGLRSIKRLFGKTLNEILNTPALFSLVKDYIDLQSQEVKLNFANKQMRIAEIAAEVFIYLKQQAEKELTTEVTQAVITVPAHFNDAARGQVMLAARLAGLEVLRLIAEPTAAAYAYGLNKTKQVVILYMI